MNNKQVVLYTVVHSGQVRIGTRVLVTPVNHTSELVSNNKPAITSPVEWIDELTGVFETRNSIYKPCF